MVYHVSCGEPAGPVLRGKYKKVGASDGIRTHDIHLGKVTLYQTELRSLPKTAHMLIRKRASARGIYGASQVAGIEAVTGNQWSVDSDS
jgi:hypothetical protein